MKICYVIVYLMIGGLFAGAVDRSHVEDCDEHIDPYRLQRVMVLWPAIITAAIVTKQTTETKTEKFFCSKKEAV